MTNKDENLTRDQKKLRAFIDKCAWAYCAYTHYKELFEGKESDLKLFEKISPRFFMGLNHILIEYVLLQICSLTDDKTTKGKENLTINNLLKTIAWPKEIGINLESKVEVLAKFREKIVSARNKTIAHADCETYLNDEVLGGFERGEDEEFFEVLEEAVNIMHEHLIGGPYEIRATNAFEPAHKFLVKLRTLEDKSHELHVEEKGVLSLFNCMRLWIKKVFRLA